MKITDGLDYKTAARIYAFNNTIDYLSKSIFTGSPSPDAMASLVLNLKKTTENLKPYLKSGDFEALDNAQNELLTLFVAEIFSPEAEKRMKIPKS